tara:strand:- start:6717 stop:6965 length:249 start_codon:yes stop_codon:yes gene_type:complete
MKVKTLVNWLKDYKEYEIDVVRYVGEGKTMECFYEPLDTSFIDGNVQIGLDGETKFMRFGIIEETDAEEPKIIVPKDISNTN